MDASAAPGALVADTPPQSLPRIADQEIPGEQVILQGYSVDEFPYPDEAGAIPLTNVTWEQAATLCQERDERLCTELEWERGGNSTAGELVGHCANGAGRSPSRASDTFGFRCRAGTVNEAKVELTITRGAKLEARESVDRDLAARLRGALVELGSQDVAVPDDCRFDRMWVWRPIGNEELVVLGGCAGIAREPACGVLVARVHLARPQALAWAPSGHWVPMVHVDVDARDRWLFGGDPLGSFRCLVSHVWGRVSVGPRERRFPKPDQRKGTAADGRTPRPPTARKTPSR